MKPRRHFLPRRLVRKYALHLTIGCTLVSTIVVRGGDILRAGRPAAPQAAATAGTTNTPVPVAPSAAARANDTLARTAQTMQALQAMQTAAHNLATGNGSNNLGSNPTQPGQVLPDVPDGIGPGGLVVDSRVTNNASLWQGANLPVQSAASGGKTQVVIKQTAQQALLNWETFNVGKNTAVKFDQSSGGANASQWIAFNRVNDPLANPTQILGTIDAPGQIYILNRNGIIFGGSSQVNVSTLVASALPINEVLVQRGLLNNPDQQFLFDGLDKGPNDDIDPNRKFGDVVVQAGAKITTPVSADGNGGRIMLVGANVRNSGTLSSAAGQTILAAGLQVGITAHKSTDPSLRGLDVYVGAVKDPASSLAEYAGTVINDGIISIAKGSTILTGKSVNQLGAIDSTTSVSLNGRIDLLANYNAVANSGYNPAVETTGNPFLYRSSGSVTFGTGSITRILPELASADKVVGSELALRSQINVMGLTIHLQQGSTILAPNAVASFKAGTWNYNGNISPPTSVFLADGGQVYIEAGAEVNLAGTMGATASVAQNLITLQLRGSELSVAPIQRDGELRGDTITVDLGQTGNYQGRDWVGTPLAELSGYTGLVERNIGQLTAAGGTLEITAGASVVLQNGSVLDVSGGSTNFTGAVVKTTRLIDSSGKIVDIAAATPDQVYKGIYTGSSTVVHADWGVVENYAHALAPSGAHYVEGYTQGGAGGGITISAPAMALDGTLVGTTVNAPNQIRNSATSSNLTPGASLTLNFQSQILNGSRILTHYPTPPELIFQSGVEQAEAGPFTTDANGKPADLAAERIEKVYLSPDLLTDSGFGNLTINNPDGNIVVPEGVTLTAGAKGAITLSGANIDVLGSIVAPGGSLSFKTYNISPYQTDTLTGSTLPDPSPNVGRGIFTLGSNGSLNTAGRITDDRIAAGPEGLAPIVVKGGQVSITAYTADLQAGGVIDVSGGYVIGANGKGRYGDGGSILIRTGQDPKLTSLLGGNLNLSSTLSGYSGAKAGSLSITAPFIQVGGTAQRADTLLLQSDFFNRGGFGSFTLTGLGAFGNSGPGATPEVLVAAGTIIEPKAKGLLADPNAPGGVTLNVIEDVVGVRTPVSLAFSAPGVEAREGGRLFAGDVVLAEGSVIKTDPGAAVSVTGTTVTVLGSIHAAGGSITIGGSGNSIGLFGDDSQALTTTYIGSHSVISAAGTTVYTPDPYGRRIGKVLDGGSIKLSGNIVAASGSVLDVSGTSAILDLDPAVVSPGGGSAGTGGVTQPPDPLATVPTRIDSHGGNITLQGGQMLFSDAVLLANAGGSTALGGSLSVSSGRFYPAGALPATGDISLVVSQSGNVIQTPLPDGTGAIGQVVAGAGNTPLPGRGYFSADRFQNGGFDSLALNGVVQFQGAVNLNARGELTIANGGILFADSEVRLTASHVTLGQPFRAPVVPGSQTNVFGPGGYAPTHGAGKLIVEAKLIDVGNFSLQGIGQASLSAANGDIRGNGTFNIAGDLTLKAGQIYPPTATDFTLVAYDYQDNGLKSGSITIQSSGSRQLPLSAGGNLSLYASVIHQDGVLRAPFGTIRLGWDGTGTAPKDLLAGGSLAIPVTKELTLGSGSITSVSAVDPLTGKGIVIPYGVNIDGTKWIDPHGVDITAGGLPQKNIVLSAGNLTLASGASVDLRGGGDLLAYRWVQGLGGPTDILASNNSYAIIPGYDADYAPYAPYNTDGVATNLIQSSGPGYVNGSLKVGDRIYLNGSPSLPAGYYTLLPARYALLPGAVLVSPSADKGVGTIVRPDKSNLVSGYVFNDLNTVRTVPTISSRFEVASGAVVRARAQYDEFLANAFLKASAISLNIPVPALPTDSGHLVFQASQTMTLLGSVASNSISGGRGSSIDISTQLDTVLSNTGVGSAPGSITLDSSVLNSFGAESLLIGGTRTRGADGIVINVTSGNLTVDNSGSPLVARDLILAAKGNLTIVSGSVIESTGAASSAADTYRLSGDGALVRVTASNSAEVVRSNVTASNVPSLVIGAGVRIRGGSIILDSSANTQLDPAADLLASRYSLSSGRISLQLDNAGTLLPNAGLVLSAGAIQDFQGASALTLRSYSSIDIYGNGEIGGGTLAQLELSAGSIRGLNQGSGSTTISANTLVLSNAPGVAGPAASTATGTLELKAQTLRLGANQVAINQYSEVVINASRGVIGEGEGGLSTQGNLTIATPRVTGAAGAKRSISAGGTLTLSTGVPTGALVQGGLGSTLNLTGSAVTIGTDILLNSGSLGIRSTTGDLTVSGRIDVSGSRQDFYDAIKYTNGGEVRLTADAGNVTVAAGGVINVSAQPGAGNAGTLAISTPLGGFTSEGTLLAKGGAGGTNGTFGLDVATLPTLGTLSSALTGAFFTESQSIRVRTGNVEVDGVVKAHDFNLSADHGSITVTGQIDASGTTGGSIRLSANQNVITASGSSLSVRGQNFSTAGKGGSISLEAGSQFNGVAGTGYIDIQTGSTLDLRVDALVSDPANSSASKGQFGGKLHLRAPLNANGTDLSINAINGSVLGASNILAEGYKVYDLINYGGIANGAQGAIQADGQKFLGTNGTASANYNAMSQRIAGGSAELAGLLVLAPGAELINSAAPASLNSTLNAANSNLVVGIGGTVLFPTGTPGDKLIRVSSPGTITAANGTVTTLASGVPTAIPAGSTVTLASGGTLTYVAGPSGTGGAIPITLTSGTTFTTGATNSVVTVASRGAVATLNNAGTSRIDLTAGTRVTFPMGTFAGVVNATSTTNRITASVAGTIISPTGVETPLAAGVATLIPIGSEVKLNSAGTLTFASGGTGGPITVALASGSFNTIGSVTVTPPSRDIVVGTPTSTTAEDWNLSTYRYGPKGAPGVLTLRSEGNLVFHNSISDGFTPFTGSGSNITNQLWLARLTAQNTALPVNTQSWSYRFVSGADLTASDFGRVKALESLAANTGSLMLGKNSTNSASGGVAATTLSQIASSYQVIRTGTGDIEIHAGRSIQLLNQFATIYTAGARIDPTLGLSFDLPNLGQTTAGGLGAAQQTYPGQYTMAGGDVTLNAQLNIEHLTRNSANQLVADSQFQMPVNWLYRRGYVDPATGQFGIGRFDEVSSTTWWVDFSNFFQGIGALGGGDVTLLAGSNISNVDAVVPTNARAPKGTPDASKLVELGGGDLIVRAGRDIDGGVYYVERGHGELTAGGSIHTNATRSVLTDNFAGSASQYTQLPTTLFLGKGGFDVSARSNVLLGPVANPFLLPGGLNNSYFNKSYFSTYAADSFVNVTSLGGDVTLRESGTILGGDTFGSASSLLQAWFSNKLQYSTSSASFSKPWLRLNETDVSAFASLASLLPGTLRVTAYSGDINLVGSMTLSPSASGTLDLFADGSINGLQPNGAVDPSGVRKTPWGLASINLSDADPSAIPGVSSPFAYQVLVGTSQGAASNTDNDLNFLTFIDNLFAESGGTLGRNTVLQTKQALHGSGPLHLNDTLPTRLYAGTGDISGFTLFSPKSTRVLAGRDITDVAFYLQNVRAGDVSVVASGRDIIPYNASSLSRVTATSAGNTLNIGNTPLPGDIQISGPGTLQVLAGRNLDLGTGASNGDGTGTGITSVGNTRNPYLPFEGADLVIGAGLGDSAGLTASDANFDAFITKYIDTADGVEYLKAIGLTPETFDTLSDEARDLAALQVFYLILRNTGRDHNNPDKPGFNSYDLGKDAIATLFPGTQWDGDILTRGRDIRTTNGGDISLFTPGGGIAMADTLIGNPLSPPGIITESGGSISIFANNNVSIGIGRIFTLRGGDEIIWSSKGDIAAGSSSKTVKSAPPTRVLIDPQSGAVKTDLAGLATGGGIGVLATVKDVPPGNVDLIAPEGTIDAGDAGIRVTGNLNISAPQVLNAGNISVGGSSAGTPSVSAPSANLGGIAAANSTVASANTAAAPANQQSEAAPVLDDTASIITAEVIGYGGSDQEEDEKGKEKEKAAEEGAVESPAPSGGQ